MTTVAEIRSEITAAQNACFKDYQIQAWIDHKKGAKADVLSTIANQAINVRRLQQILEPGARREATLAELNRRVLNIIKVPAPNPRVIVFINAKLKAKAFDFDLAVDAMLAFLYFLQAETEALLSDGGAATVILDMRDAPLPPATEVLHQGKLMGLTVGRSFPGLFPAIRLCSNWNVFVRRAAQVLSATIKVPVQFTSPAELLADIGAAHLPTILGGRVDINGTPPMGDLVARHFASSDFLRRMACLLGSSAPKDGNSPRPSLPDVSSRSTSPSIPQQPDDLDHDDDTHEYLTTTDGQTTPDLNARTASAGEVRAPDTDAALALGGSSA